MAVQTVGFEFTVKDISLQEAFVRMKKGMKDLELAADNLKLSKIGDDAKISLDVTGKSIKAITADLQALKMMFIDTSVASEKISSKPFTQLKASIEGVIKSLKEANDLSLMFGKSSLLSGTPKANISSTGNAEIRAVQNKLNEEVAKAQKDFEESSIKDKKVYDAKIKALYAQSAIDILAIVTKTQAALANITAREGTIKLGQSNTKEFLAQLQQDILKINTTQRYGLDSREKAVVDNAQKEQTIRRKLSADLLAEEKAFQASSTSSQTAYLASRVALEKKAAKEIKDIQTRNVRAQKFDDKAGTYSSGFKTDVKNLSDSYKEQAAIAREGANSLQALQRRVANERLQIETKLAADVKAIEDKTYTDLMSGAKNNANNELAILRKHYSDALKEVEIGEAAILRKIQAEAARQVQASKVSLIGNYQQQLQTESNQRLALLEAGYAREKAVRDKGATSIQAQQAAIAEKRIKLEQDTAKELERIQSLVGKKASLGGISVAEAGKQSKAIIDHSHATTDALNKQSAALEKTKSAHMNLTSFIGTSMIIWQSWNFALTTITSSLQAIPKVGMELDSTISVLKATMGGSAGAAAGLKALDEEAKRTGINIVALRENWRTFSASTVVAGETMDTAWKMFSNVNTVVTALHYSGDKATHIFMALSQMFNKSKVQSEELVKQLGNLLPAAYGMFAKSMGKTTSELAIQMKKGLVFAHDTLPKFLADYEEMFKISFANASKSLNAEVGRMQNEFIKLGEAIYKVTEEDMVAIVRKLKEFAQTLGENPAAIKNLTDHIKTLGEALLILATIPAATKLWEFLKFIKANPVSLVIMGVATALITVKEALDKVETSKFRNLSEEVANFTKKAEDIKPISIKINIDEDENVKKASQLLKDVQKELKDTSLGFNDTIERTSTFIKLFNLLTFNTAASFARMVKNIAEGNDLLAANILPYEQMQTKGTKSKETPYLIPEKIFQFNNGKDDKEGSSLKETGFKVYVDKKQFEIYQRELLAAEEQVKKNIVQARQEAIISEKGFTTERLVLKETELDKISKMEIGAIKDLKQAAIKEEEIRYEEQLQTMKGFLTKEEGLITAQKEKVDKAETSNLIGTEKEKAIKAAKDSLAEHEADIKKYQTNVEMATAEHTTKLERINQQYAKKDEELAKKQIELAKKTAEELKQIEETKTKDKIREIEKQITALEETKSDLAISTFYDQQIKYLEQEISLKKESLKITQDTNAELIKTISINQTPKDVNSLIAAIRGGEARSGASSYELYPTGIKGKGGKPASTAKGDMQVLDSTYQEMLAKHPEVKEASLESAGKARVLAGEYLLKDLLAYYKDADIAAAAYFSGTGMGTGTKVPVNAAFGKAGVKIGTEDPAELAKVVSILKSDTSNRNGQSIAGYLRNFDKNYGRLDGSSLSAETTALKDNSATLEEIAQIEERISKLKVSQKKEYKDVFKQIAGIHAEYLLYTGKIEEGVEEKFANKHKDLLKAINLELATTNKTEAERNDLLKARNELQALGLIQAKEIASAKAMKSLGKEEKSIDKQLATISQMESLNLLDPISAMMRRSDKKSNSLIPNLEKQLTELQGRDLSIMPEEKKDSTLAAIDEIQTKLLELSATANESFTFTANMISEAFDTTFRGILDGTIKGKDAFKEFGKSILKTMQEIVLQAIKSQIVGLILKGAGAISGSLMGDSAVANPTGTFATNGIPYKNSNGNVIPFSRGGIPDIGNEFQTFQMANGAAGSLREQGKYEAIMPLKRNASGELGVIAGNQVASNDQRQYNINVNVVGGADVTNASDIGHQIAIATMEKIADTRIANASRIGNSQNRTTAFGGR